jgi:CRP/FNR family transcriptional regulator, cyclic AMP receptor protein
VTCEPGDVRLEALAGHFHSIAGCGIMCMATQDQRVPVSKSERLKRVPVLAELPEAVIERISQACSWREVAPGSQILGYLEPSSDVCFLVAGKVRVIVYSFEGKAVVFGDLAAGAMFGEIAAVDGKPRSATVEALEACTVARLSSDQLESLLIEEPRLALAMLRHFAGDVRRLSDRVLEFSTLAVQNRIHAELLRLARAAAGADAHEALLSPAPSLSDIAGRISTHREAVSREISRLANSSLLRREGRDLRVADVRRLAALVAEAKGD